MKVQVFDFRWNDESSCRIEASSGDKFGKKQIQKGDSLSLEIVSERPRCAGYMQEGEWKPCLNQEIGKPKCELCRAKEGNFAVVSFDGFNTQGFDPAELEKLKYTPHFVYLALFDEGVLKVGVSNQGRKVLRQLEQGSHATLYIAETPDGIAARQIETLARKAGIADKIMKSQKKDLICTQIPKEKAQTELQEAFAKIQETLKDHDYLQKFIFEKPEFQWWDDEYGLPEIQNPHDVHFITLKEEEFVSGTIKAIKGPFIILEIDPDNVVAINAKSLRGRDIEFAPKPPGMSIKGAIQSSLF